MPASISLWGSNNNLKIKAQISNQSTFVRPIWRASENQRDIDKLIFVKSKSLNNLVMKLEHLFIMPTHSTHVAAQHFKYFI